jgi:hypothetical protein
MARFPLKIFVSSPGDVAQERFLAEKIITRLRHLYQPVCQIEPIFWEHEPLVATQSFQEGLISPRDTDIVVCILWSRLGTRLPKSVTGGAHLTGTEYEFVEAMQGRRQNGVPDLLVYRKQAKPLADLSDKQRRQEALSQIEALEAFIDRWFHDDDRALIAAFHPFERADEFEEHLEHHLRKLIDKRLAAAGISAEDGLPLTPTWIHGSPFRGLNHFDFEHDAIFFGRTQAIGEVVDRLKRQAERNRAFLVILGMSGCGKSSLARAGVLPALSRPGVIEGVGLCRRAVMRPGDGPGDLFDTLAAALLRPDALPEIASDGTSAEQLARSLRDNPASAALLVKGAVSQAAADLKPAEDGAGQPGARFLFVVDQLEELFTLETISDDDRRKFARVIQALACDPLSRSIVLATLRSDFYAAFARVPEFAELKEGLGSYDLRPPTSAEIGQLIREPAAAGGLRFETDAVTGPLDDLLRDEAVQDPSVLPLLEFTLDELYERRTPQGKLTFAAYQELGGVKGALATRAESAFAALPAAVQRELLTVFRQLVTIGTLSDETPTRRQAPLSRFASSPERMALVQAFIGARLFVTDQEGDGEAVVRLTHESLLSRWGRLQSWLDDDRERLRVKARVEAATARWDGEGRPADLLLPAGKPIQEAEQLVTAGFELDPAARDLIAASSERARRNRTLRRGAVASLAALALLAAMAGGFAEFQRRRAVDSNTALGVQKTKAESAAAQAIAAKELAQKRFEQVDQANEIVNSLVLTQDPSLPAFAQVPSERALAARLAEITPKLQGIAGGDPLVLAKLRRAVGTAELGIGENAQAIAMLGAALPVYREEYGEDDPRTLEVAMFLGNAHFAAAQFPSVIATLENALPRAEKVLEAGDELTFKIRLVLASARFQSGDQAGGVALMEQAITDRTAAHGDDDTYAFWALHLLSSLYGQSGQRAKAREVIDRLLVRVQAVDRDSQPFGVYSGAFATLTPALKSQDPAEMIKGARAVYAADRKNLGPYHPRTTTTALMLTQMLHVLGQGEEAVSFGEENQRILEERYGESHFLTLSNRVYLGLAYFGLKKYDRAFALAEPNHEPLRALLGPDHTIVSDSAALLAICHQRRKEPDKALARLQEALDSSRKSTGETTPNSLNLQMGLVQLLKQNGRREEARALLARTHETAREALGADDLNTLEFQSKRAEFLLEIGSAAEAIRLLEDAVFQVELRDDPAPQLAKSLVFALDQAYSNALDSIRPQVVELREEALARWREAAGETHPGTLRAQRGLARSLIDSGDRQAGMALYERLLPLHKTALPPNDPDTLALLNALASGYRDPPVGQGRDMDKAIAYQIQIAEFAKNYDPDPIAYLRERATLGAVYERARRDDEALKIYEDLLKQKEMLLADDVAFYRDLLSRSRRIWTQLGEFAKALQASQEHLALTRANERNDSFGLVNSLRDLATAQANADQPDAQAATLEELEPIMSNVPAFYNRNAVAVVEDLAGLYLDAGQGEKAVALMRKHAELLRTRAPKGSLAPLKLEISLASLLQELNQTEEAIPLAESASQRLRSGSRTDPEFSGTQALLALCLLKLRLHEEAEPHLRECLAMRTQTMPDSWLTFNTRSMLGETLLGQKKFGEAEPFLLSGYEGLKAREASIPPQAKVRFTEAIERLVELYEQTGNTEEAAKWRGRLAETGPPPRRDERPVP